MGTLLRVESVLKKVIVSSVNCVYTPNSKSLERAWSRGIVYRTKGYSFVLPTMPRLHAHSRLLELGVCTQNSSTQSQILQKTTCTYNIFIFSHGNIHTLITLKRPKIKL